MIARLSIRLFTRCCLAPLVTFAEPFLEKSILFTERSDGFTLYRIPGVVVTLKLSRDDGRTWPVMKTLQSGPSAYSDLAVLPDGTILCFHESGADKPAINRKRDWAYANLTLARFNLEWLTNP